MQPSIASAPPRRSLTSSGFTLIELVLVVAILGIVVAALVSVLMTSMAQKKSVTNEVASTSMARAALDMMARDLRSAGFNVDNNHATPQPPIAYVDSLQILMSSDLAPSLDTSQTARGIPLAYNPVGSPRPNPLIGTSWTPPARYRTGAELVRWTLDLNNDGAVDAADQSATDALEASRTPNPNDFELVREVYGDSTGGISGNNGGVREPVAVVSRPAGGNPPLFRVYMQGEANAWDWSNGPVPANRLQEISRIDINVVAPSATKNFRGRYATTQLTTSVNSIRNSPNYSFVTYAVSGVVYNDANSNLTKEGGEAGVEDALVTLGGYMSQTTSSSGTYAFTAPPGTYVLKCMPPPNVTSFGVDSFTVTVGPAATRNFATKARLGGWLALTVWNDVNHDRNISAGEGGVRGVVVTVNETGETYTTDENGLANIFVPVGVYKVEAAVPDSFVCSTTNPITVNFNNGDNKTAKIGMYIVENGKYAGYVFNDADMDGLKDGNEVGVKDALIFCTLPDGTYLSTLSDKNGRYILTLPYNDPPHTTSYTVECTPPSGYASSSSLTKTDIWLKNDDFKDNNNFALSKFAISKFDISEPVSAFALADVIENDWRQSSIAFARKDLDLLMGSDDGSASVIGVWFNQFDLKPPYKNNKDCARNIAFPIWTICPDTVNAGASGISRPDVIYGSTYSPSGNWGIYTTQDGSGNEGFLGVTPRWYLTSDNGDVTSIVTVPGGAGASPEILVGTRSPTANHGVIESWTAASHTNPVYTRAQTMPPTGSIPSNNLGKVTGMVMGDFITGIAGNELLVGTQTGYYSGQLMIFRKTGGNWQQVWTVTLANDAVTCVAAGDINADGRMDILIGTQSSNSSGHVIWYKNKGGGSASFDTPDIEDARGIVTAIAVGEFGGTADPDVVTAWRENSTSHIGGLELWVSIDQLPDSSTDPSGGQVTEWVTALEVGNLNYGVYPLAPDATQLDDIVCAVRKDTNKSSIYTLVR